MDKLKLWDKTPLFDESIDQAEPTLTPYLLNDGKPHGAVIVCPGGAYFFRAFREGEPIAMRLMAAGFHTAILHYDVKPARWPKAALQLAAAVREVRIHAED